MVTLALDAATAAASAAIVMGDRVLAERDVAMRGERSERLMPAVADVLAAAGQSVADVERIVVGAGPGSFTSLRIAASIAKGIALTRRVPLLAVPSLLLMVAGADETRDGGRYLAVLDAMRGDVFVAGYEVRADGGFTELAAPVLIPRSSVAQMAGRLAARCVGPGESLNVGPHARGVARLACWLNDGEHEVDITAWEPDYGRLAEAQVRWEAAHGRTLPRV
jgi:tRNA threonylcarbamoyladenosine biosynthesis protein TsaB